MISQTKNVTTIIFEEHVVTQEKWHRSHSWQMTLRLGLSEPPCEQELEQEQELDQKQKF